MSKCPICGASFPTNSFVCEYCGHVMTERIKQVTTTTVISFDDSLDLIQDNLNALHNIHKPSALKGIVAFLRVLAAFQTFGIILFFWKKPHNRFDKNNYNKLKKIILRNIDLLKISSKGSQQLISRIRVVENELTAMDKEIKRSLQIKQIIVSILIVGFFSFIYFNKSNLNYTYSILPSNDPVTGVLSDCMDIELDKYTLKLKKDPYLTDLKLKIRIDIIQQYELEENQELEIKLYITDKNNNDITDYLPAKLEKRDISSIIRKLKKGTGMKYVTVKIHTDKELNEFLDKKLRFRIYTNIIEIPINESF